MPMQICFHAMRHAVILAGGSGTRLWPMSRRTMPKQLLPLIRGKSLIELAFARLDGLVPPERRWICAAEEHRSAIRAALPEMHADRYLGEPVGRDTLAALAFSSAVIARMDREATIIVLTADHLIEPHDAFRAAVGGGLDAAESGPGVLVTFGIAPTRAATGFGYLRLGKPFLGHARAVEEFKEKPDAPTAEQWVGAGPDRFLWNSGMFVWKAATFLDCVKRYEPAEFDGVSRIADAWGTPAYEETIGRVYPGLKKISVDFAVMEKASRDPAVTVAAVPMALSWKDIGSWPSFAETCPTDAAGNSIAAEKTLLLETRGTLVVSSDPAHLVAVSGCDDLVIVHTPSATLVCRKDKAEELKKLQAMASERFGPDYV
jgi:mannose-1-phosphate guanylyltransferase